MYEWLRDYIKLQQDIEYLEFKIEQNQIELKRWVEGDLRDVKLDEKSIAAGLEERIEAQFKLLNEKKKQRDDLINFVNKFEGLDNQILRMKWMEGKSLEQIADELNYSHGYIKQKHAEIMKIIRFAEILTQG
jgi:DNA-directed RNA polymerase specialized sigma subunit